jgi:hypothetical protein
MLAIFFERMTRDLPLFLVLDDGKGKKRVID